MGFALLESKEKSLLDAMCEDPSEYFTMLSNIDLTMSKAFIQEDKHRIFDMIQLDSTNEIKLLNKRCVNLFLGLSRSAWMMTPFP